MLTEKHWWQRVRQVHERQKYFKCMNDKKTDGSHPVHRMHENSLRAFDEEQKNLGAREGLIYNLIKNRPGMFTDREILAWTGQSDPNYVRPRITGMIDRGLLVESESKAICNVTKKHVRMVRAATKVEYENFCENKSWSEEMPTTVGRYEIKCMETEYKPHPVEVFQHETYNELWANDPDVGKYPLETYHSNLCKLSWRKIKNENQN